MFMLEIIETVLKKPIAKFIPFRTSYILGIISTYFLRDYKHLLDL